MIGSDLRFKRSWLVHGKWNVECRKERMDAQAKMMIIWKVATEVGRHGRTQGVYVLETGSTRTHPGWIGGMRREGKWNQQELPTSAWLQPYPRPCTHRHLLLPLAANTKNSVALVDTSVILISSLCCTSHTKLALHEKCSVIHPLLTFQVLIVWLRPISWGTSLSFTASDNLSAPLCLPSSNALSTQEEGLPS